MSFENLRGTWTECKGAPIRLRHWPLLVMLAAGVTAELQEESCEAVSATQAAHSHSLLQVSKPHRAGSRDKVQFHLNSEASEAPAPTRGSTGPQGVRNSEKLGRPLAPTLSARSKVQVQEDSSESLSPKAVKNVQLPARRAGTGKAHGISHGARQEPQQARHGGAQGLSFFQMSESISEDSSRVSEDIPKAAGVVPGDAITNDAITNAESMLEKAITDVAVKANEVEGAWWRPFVDAAMIIAILVSVALSISLLTKRCSHMKWFTHDPRACPGSSVLLTRSGHLAAPPAVQMQTSVAETPLKSPMLPETGVSFAIPLTHHTEAGTNAALRFHVPRRPDGPPVFATVKCAPDHNSWAKIEVTAGGFDGSAPLATCSLIQSASDDESRNVQGAMLSWLSLLLHEKNDTGDVSPKDKESGTGTPRSSTSGTPRSLQRSRARVCLHGMAEDLVHAGIGSAGGQGLHLEVKDGMCASLGRLEPGEKPYQYVLMKQGKSILDIEAQPNSRSFTLSKRGQVVAIATDLGGKRDPEDPELTGEEDEYLQVDIKTGSKWPEIALFMTCVLAMIVFKPEASMIKEDEQDVIVSDKKSQIDTQHVQQA